MMKTTVHPLVRLCRRISQASRPRVVRTIRQFAEEEIILTEGKFKDQRFRVARQPLAGLFLDEFDSGRWRRFATTGPTQDGKTFLTTVVPSLYHLFELRDTVVYGAPNMDMARDKWEEDLLPAIKASSFRDQIPDYGSGSKRGKINRVQFKNGATLRFMSGGGGDENRSGFTARAVFITEVDKLDKRSSTSREGDKVGQMEERVGAHAEDARVYLECTVSYEHGRIWQEIHTKGSASRIVLPCPHCGDWVTPEREHLVGWQDAADEIAAGRNAGLCCPKCGVIWSELQRVEANRNCRLLHRGQTISGADGRIEGALPPTNTLGFRWSIANSLLKPIKLVAEQEWNARRAPDEDNEDQKLQQFKWARPYKPKDLDEEELDYHAILRRTVNDPEGRVPSDAEFLVTAIDVGKWLCHWGTVAMRSDSTPHVVEYGVIEVPSADMEEKRALMLALREFRDQKLSKGWESDGGPGGGPMHAELVLIDEGYLTPVVRAFCRESGGLAAGYAPAKGFGITQYLKQAYHHPRKVSETVAHLGDQYHLARISGQSGSSGSGQGGRIRLFDINADHWKIKVHAALRTPMGKAGAMTLYQPSKDEQGRPRVNDHLKIAKHFTAERLERKFVEGVGWVMRLRAVTRNNHHLDMASMAMVALDYVAAKRERDGGDRPSSRLARTPAAAEPVVSADPVVDDEGGSEPAPEAPAKAGWFGSRRKR